MIFCYDTICSYTSTRYSSQHCHMNSFTSTSHAQNIGEQEIVYTKSNVTSGQDGSRHSWTHSTGND